MASQGCGSCANVSSHTLCPPLKICSAASLGYSSCLTASRQPGMISGDHNLREQIPVAFISSCCAFSIISRSQRKSNVVASAFRAVGGKGQGTQRSFGGIWDREVSAWYLNNDAANFKISSHGLQKASDSFQHSSLCHQPIFASGPSP